MKPFQSLLTFSHSAGKKNIFQNVLLSFFSVLGHKDVLGPSQTHFSPRLAARAKMSLSRAQNIFNEHKHITRAQNIFNEHKLYCYILRLSNAAKREDWDHYHDPNIAFSLCHSL